MKMVLSPTGTQSGWELSPPQVFKAPPSRRFRCSIPGVERDAESTVLFVGLQQFLAADYVHGPDTI